MRRPMTAGRFLGVVLAVMIACAQLLGAGRLLASPEKMVGEWKVEITFAKGEVRSVCFAAQESGKGFYLPSAPAPNRTAPAEKVEGEWLVGADGKVVFSGPVQFPLGNVGLQRGVLVLTGKTTDDGSFAGAATFFPPGQEPKDPKKGRGGLRTGLAFG